MQTFGKRSPFSEKHLQSFIDAYGEDPNGQSERVEGVFDILGCSSEGVEHINDNARWRKFSRAYIAEKGDDLNITWLKDNCHYRCGIATRTPDVLATEAMTELTEALREINQLMIELGATEQAEGQVALLAEEFGLEKAVVKGQG